ncbi:MAG: SMP-30/gluconolactonase/LRE family protein [Bacillota bacterium]
MEKLFFHMVSLILITSILFPQGKVKILADNSKLEKVFDGGFSTEGPAEGPDGFIYFSDQTFTSESGAQAGHIWRFDPRTLKTIIFRSPSGMSNGIKFTPFGNMITAHGADFGLRCIIETDWRTQKSRILSGLFNNKPFNSPNDLTIDKKGRIYFTDPRYVGHEPVDQPVMGVYRVDPDGKVELIISDVSMPNGIAVSPDETTIYVGCFDEGTEEDSTAEKKRMWNMAILAYKLNDKGQAHLKNTFVDYGTEEGPDGITVDENGNLYVAVRKENDPGIYVYSPEGKQLDYIATPEIPTNLAFSRHSDKNYLYITAGKSLYRIEVLAKGYFVTK